MVGKTGSAVVGTSASRRRKSGRGSSAPLVTGAPAPYDLNFIQSKTWIGVPLFHYMSNWEETGGRYNFTTSSGDPAKVGDRVGRWANTYLAAGQGDAVVAVDVGDPYGGNFFGASGQPTLVERTYDGKTLKGLEFTGTEYMQISGSSVTEPYGVPSPMFGTGGSQWNGNTGATFLFVIDQDPYPDIEENTLANNTQSLLISRQPVATTFGGPPTGFTWPETEDFGIQYFRQGATYGANPIFTKQRWGPESAYQNNMNSGFSLTQSPYLGYGGAKYGELRTVTGDDMPGYAEHVSSQTLSGLQMILLEYDNKDHLKHDATSTTNTIDRNYEGPKVKVYGISRPPASGHWAWPSSQYRQFDRPTLIGGSPALKDHTLFHDKIAFLGGTPPCQISPFAGGNAYGNGFRGVIYEVMMLEGVLSDLDKSRLAKILQRKYPL
mgnify:CR=1 FL=1